jgi:hypothetical protein
VEKRLERVEKALEQEKTRLGRVLEVQGLEGYDDHIHITCPTWCKRLLRPAFRWRSCGGGASEDDARLFG